MKKPKLKICGMKYNIAEVATLRPDYMGFIFYKHSQRFFEGIIPTLPSGTKKVGVFVNATLKEITEKVNTYCLDVIQLHGEETPEFCRNIRNFKKLDHVNVWRVFSIKDAFNFNQLHVYESVVDKFLFDTKGKDKGGNGFTFNWDVLKKYDSEKPFILSGGIGLQQLPALNEILKTDLPIYAVDVNSRFEIEPGKKHIDHLKQFIHEL
jgi:phosphoribosylanthranilate isomerase